jgi:ubiquinone/menaquinone biosynthesis C-methylase UbiE
MESFHYDFLYNQELEHWWYKVRRKIIRDILVNAGMWKGGLKILDAGCGTGAQLLELTACGEVHGLDFAEKAVEYCHSRKLHNVQRGSICEIPFSNDTFDLVIALDVIEHVQDDNRALSELYRVLKPGGMVIIFVPAFMFLWSITDEVSHHFRRYTAKELGEKISKQNLQVVRTSYFNTFLFFPILFIRWMVRLFRLPMKSEDGSPGKLVNGLFYRTFLCESALLKHMNFPFGVSAMMVARKPAHS